MLTSKVRTLQRYLIPNWFITIYHYIKHKALVSFKAEVQYTKNITFGKGTVVKSYAAIQTHKGKISIGKNCAISMFNLISTSDADITIGDYTRFGSGVTMLASRRKFSKKNIPIIEQGYDHVGIRIGSDVLIGTGSVILHGVEIGDGAIIGANSVIRESIPPYSIVSGSPPKIVGKRS